MKRVHFVLLATVVLACSVNGEKTSRVSRAIYDQAIVVDTHADTLQRVLIGDHDISKKLDSGHVDFPRMKEGGLDAEFFAIWVDSPYRGSAAVKRGLQLVDAMYRMLEKAPASAALAVSASDVERLSRQGKVAALMGIEGGHAIDNDLGVLRLFHRLGVRYMTLTWSNTNDWADSSGDRALHNGLTDFGRQVVREMNRIGMIVDISHVSDKTFWDTLQVAAKPVIASHSSARALAGAPRNMTDDMLRAVARNGGVVGVNFYSSFLSDDYRSRSSTSGKRFPSTEELMQKHDGNVDRVAAERYRFFEQMAAVTPPPFAVLIDHIDHIAKVAGVDHVGLGSDFDGVDSLPQGIHDVRDLSKIAAALLERGYSEQDVKKILGGNFLRVIREVTGK